MVTQMGLIARRGQPPGRSGLTALTLCEEHILLLWQVTASTEKLLTAADDGR